MNDKGEQLTELQQAVMEHDDDMARLDRNNNPLQPVDVAGVLDAERAWQQVRDGLNRDGAWSPTMIDVFQGFFISGWNHRGMIDALATRPATTPGDEHVDATVLNGPLEGASYCKVCGLMRPHDGWKKPCKGPVELSLRATPPDITERARRAADAIDLEGFIDNGFIAELAKQAGRDPDEFFEETIRKLTAIIAAEFERGE